MEPKGTVKFLPHWIYETFLYQNYGFSHTKEQRSKAFAQFIYCLNEENKSAKNL